MKKVKSYRVSEETIEQINVLKKAYNLPDKVSDAAIVELAVQRMHDYFKRMKKI